MLAIRTNYAQLIEFDKVAEVGGWWYDEEVRGRRTRCRRELSLDSLTTLYHRPTVTRPCTSAQRRPNCKHGTFTSSSPERCLNVKLRHQLRLGDGAGLAAGDPKSIRYSTLSARMCVAFSPLSLLYAERLFYSIISDAIEWN